MVTSPAPPTHQAPRPSSPRDAASIEPGSQEKIPVLIALPEPEPEVSTSSKTPWVVSTFLLLLLTAAALLFYRELIQPHQKIKPLAPTPITKPTHVSTFQWQPQARELLQQFFAATTPEAKARCVIGGLATVERLQQTWGKQLLNETPLDPNDFAAIAVDPTASQPQVFLMIYERPAQYDIQKFLRPLVSMEVMQGMETLDPLTKSVTAPELFETPPLNVQAYLKLVEGKLLLDYDIYLQTRHRTLQRFAESAPPGSQETFRVIVEEDVPLPHDLTSSHRIYRVTDPIHTADSYRVFSADDRSFAKNLAELHWHRVPSTTIQHRAATITLTKREDQRIELTDFLCWQFLGLETSSSPQPTDPSPSRDLSPLPPDP